MNITRQLDDKAKSFKAGPSDTVAVSTEYGADSRSSSTPYPCCVRVPSMWTWSSTLGRLAMNGVIVRPFMFTAQMSLLPHTPVLSVNAFPRRTFILFS
jgi:hypothetical protein